MNRSEAEKLVKDLYAARMKGDVDGIMKLMTSDVTLDVLGSAEHSQVAVANKGAESVRRTLSVFCESFEASNFEIITMLVDGDNIAFHWNVRIRSPKSGKSIDTQIMDFWTVRDGKVTAISQGVDTAMVAWLTTP